MRLSRRQILAGAAASLGTAGLAQTAPLQSYRPVARPDLRISLQSLVARAGLSGQVAVVVADAATGSVLETLNPALPLPPASVTKAVTAAYARAALGDDFRFTTRLLADGPVVAGVLQGDLILAGGGDPTLTTDHLAMLAQALPRAGIRAVAGDFILWDAALPRIAQIDPAQLPTAGYNPAISGLNLNFNRVHFSWSRAGGAITTAIDARSETHSPPVTVARVQIVDRDLPVFTYRAAQGVDIWTVARSALNAQGARWLPVRAPGLYAAEVFAGFARSQGVVLPTPRTAARLPSAAEIGRIDSAAMPQLLRDMLRYSTNLTAEALGLMAGMGAGTPDLRRSAAMMTDWAVARAPGIAPVFVDHSGLGSAARISPADMVRFLQAPDVMPRLRPLLRDIALVDANQTPITAGQAMVQAKTGTLYFVATLAGYLRSARGRDLSFAIFAADLAARDAALPADESPPPGARAWSGRARQLQQDILQHWALRAF